MRKISKEDFVIESKKVHNNLFDYSLVKYINNTTKVSIVCSKHGIFQQTPKNHKKGHACPNCALYLRHNTLRTNNSEFIEKSREVHGDTYDYTLVKFKNNKTNVRIICKIHGEFKQQPSHHYSGSGCPECSGNKITSETFINRIKVIHGDYYDYSLVDYINNKKHITIICPTHGKFKQLPKYHLIGAGCPICRESRGEREIRLYLIENGINFISQYRIKECRDKLPLPFDFYLPDFNTCIEYDGEQHYKEVKRFGGISGFNDRVKKDKIKTKYCNENDVNLLRIKYNEDVIAKLTEII
jgi:very-short-patch-repair endonuclease